jgi:hypothetical protein
MVSVATHGHVTSILKIGCDIYPQFTASGPYQNLASMTCKKNSPKDKSWCATSDKNAQTSSNSVTKHMSQIQYFNSHKFDDDHVIL